MTDDQRIYAIYQKLADSITDENGYGGPVRHIAYYNDWTLTVRTSDWGDLTVSAWTGDGNRLAQSADWRLYDASPDGTFNWALNLPEPTAAKCQLADMMEKVEWIDELQRT